MGGKARKTPDAARSALVWWRFPEAQGPWTAWYNEETVRETTEGSYFCAAGFAGGYFGIQDMPADSPTARRILFSVWDAGSDGAGDGDSNAVPQSDRVEVVYTAPGHRGAVQISRVCVPSLSVEWSRELIMCVK